MEEIPAEEIDAKFLLQSYSSSEGPVGRGGCSVSLVGEKYMGKTVFFNFCLDRE